MTFEELQKTYPLFSYDSYSYELKPGLIELSFQFSCGDEKLTTVDTISGVTEEMVKKISKPELDEYIFQLGIAEIPSYWKAFLSPTIEIQCGNLDATQIQFWQKLFYFGLGEFFYQNKIKPFKPEFKSTERKLSFDRLEYQVAQDDKLEATSSKLSAVLVPVGGGKDSIVTLELLAVEGRAIYTWSGLKGSSADVIDLFGSRHPRLGDIVFSRTLDSRLSELNSEGHPNGHTPFSSVLAFFTILTARLYEIPQIAISNESSSNEPTGTWEGIDINHQYSKSVEFERDFQSYVTSLFGSSSPRYFSYLRSMNELAIMEKFVTFPEYFEVFHSCNVGQKDNVWCGKCGKCAFVALLLSAYLDDETIARIFRSDVMNQDHLIPHFDALLGKVEFKPFECVGTRSESIEALKMALHRREGKELPLLLQHYA